jgi:glycerol-3-phosphate dehydrogenase (NAD(P)+)
LWARDEAAARLVQDERENRRYLPGIQLPDTLTCTSDIAVAVDGAGIVIVAVPSFAVDETSRLLAPYLPATALVMSGAKGLESETGRRLSEVIEARAPGVRGRLAVLSGPNLAREAARDMPTATVVASCQPEVAQQLQTALSLPQFRIYTNPDVVGVELGGALKNMIAIAAGITDGLGYGENTKAALVSRGLSEIRRLGRALV